MFEREKSMTMTERSTAVGVFTDRVQAERAITELRRAGFRDDQIGFVMSGKEQVAEGTLAQEHRGDTATGAATGAVGGGVIGGILGAAASLLIPGFGPAIAGGILAATLGGVVLGAVAGGIVGALTSMGVPEEEARYYESELNTGRTIVTVSAPGRYLEALSILRENGGYDANTRERASVIPGGVARTRVDEQQVAGIYTPGVPRDSMRETDI